MREDISIRCTGSSTSNGPTGTTLEGASSVEMAWKLPPEDEEPFPEIQRHTLSPNQK